MIKVDKGQITIKGARPIVHAEVATLISGLKDVGFSENEIKEAVRLGLMDSEELDKLVDDTQSKLKKDLHDLADLLDKLLAE